jgi:hypothetical protein
MRYNREVDYRGVQSRRAGTHRFQCKVFYAAGVNHLWAIDQHDKWLRFGLHMHVCIEPFVGKILWMVVWWTTSDPLYVAKQYFNAIQAFGGDVDLFILFICLSKSYDDYG